MVHSRFSARRLLFPLLCFAALLLAGCATLRRQPAPPASEYGIWFSYGDYRALCSGMDQAQFSAFTEQAVANMTSIGITTLYLHAVAFTDALYQSEIYPPSAYLPSADYDPFALFLQTAHRNGIRVEAWINPMRSCTAAEAENLPDGNIIRRWIDGGSGQAVFVNNRWYLNPAYPEVRALVCSVAKEIIANYSVDGIHLDDYFYPENCPDEFDAPSFAEALSADSSLTQSAFRTARIDALVSELYKTVHTASPQCELSISPSGNYEHTRDALYADPVRWIAAGTVDTLIPQIYWGFEHHTKPFQPTLAQWRSFTDGTSVRLVIGLAAYKVGQPDTYAGGDAITEWIRCGNLLDQERTAALTAGCAGVAYFSYQSLFAPAPETADSVKIELQNMTCSTPETQHDAHTLDTF